MITGYNPFFHPELPWFRGPPPRLGCLACHGIPGRSLPSRGVIGVIQHGKNRQFSSNEKLYTYIYIRMFIDIQICDIELYTSWSEGDGGKDTYVYIYTYTCICYRYVVILKFWSRLWISQSHYHFDSLLFDISTFFLLQHDCLCTYIYISVCELRIQAVRGSPCWTWLQDITKEPELLDQRTGQTLFSRIGHQFGNLFV